MVGDDDDDDDEDDDDDDENGDDARNIHIHKAIQFNSVGKFFKQFDTSNWGDLMFR